MLVCVSIQIFFFHIFIFCISIFVTKSLFKSVSKSFFFHIFIFCIHICKDNYYNHNMLYIFSYHSKIYEHLENIINSSIKQKWKIVSNKIYTLNRVEAMLLSWMVIKRHFPQAVFIALRLWRVQFISAIRTNKTSHRNFLCTGQ